jgi:hypothetical protein
MSLRIGFYGHSTCTYRGPESFIDIVANALDAEIVNTGVRMGSEERALIDLKRTKPDIAIVFHSQSRLVFSPNREYDFDASSEWGLHTDEIDMLYSYRTYFRHKELERARFYGAAMQIEQYCKDTNIFVINCIDPKHPFPDWLCLSNKDITVMTIARFNKCGFNEGPNGVTTKGNLLIADRLLNTIAARDGEVKRV